MLFDVGEQVVALIPMTAKDRTLILAGAKGPVAVAQELDDGTGLYEVDFTQGGGVHRTPAMESQLAHPDGTAANLLNSMANP